jgi:hypothetical protein
MAEDFDSHVTFQTLSDGVDLLTSNRIDQPFSFPSAWLLKSEILHIAQNKMSPLHDN